MPVKVDLLRQAGSHLAEHAKSTWLLTKRKRLAEMSKKNLRCAKNYSMLNKRALVALVSGFLLSTRPQ